MKTLKIFLVAVLSLLGGGLWLCLSGSGSAVGNLEVLDEAANTQIIKEKSPDEPEVGQSSEQGSTPSSPAQVPLPAAPVATVFGETGPVTIESVPRGRFHEQLLAITPAAREKALKTLGELRVPLLDVRSLHVDSEGMLFYACNPNINLPGESPEISGISLPEDTKKEADSAAVPSQASVPISAPPIRSSKPGAESVIYLDFNGHTVTGTAWNTLIGRTSFQCVPFDVDGDPTTFSDAEQAFIVEVWERVSEDFKAFNINVTTVEPATFTTKTARALITKNKDAAGANNPSSTAGGVGYLNVFGTADYPTRYSPTFAYFNSVANLARNVAEVVSHEVGHNLGLSHDGTKSAEYYTGHGTGEASWAAIMGASYNRNFTQWSKGEYYNSNNSQDDLAIISAKSGWASDDIGGSTTDAASVTMNGNSFLAEGHIGGNSDSDLHRITTNQTVLTVNAESFKIAGSATFGSNLGIKLELLSPSGTLVASSTASGQSTGTLTSNISPGTYFIRVSGSGNGSPLASAPTGFASYASMGAYKLWGTAGSANNSFAPVLGNGSSSSTTTNSTRVSASVNPNGLATNFYFQYGNSPSLGAVTANQSAGSGIAPVAMSATLSGLLPNSTYYYRAVASNSAGTIFGETQSVTTISNIVTIQSLSLSNGTLNPVFSTLTRNYTASVANDVTAITATWLTSHANATSQVRINTGNFTTVARGANSPSLPLVVGNNTITIRVTAQDGVTAGNHTIIVARQRSSNTELSALTASAGALSPAFDPATTTYSLTVPNSVTSTTLNATKTTAGGKLEVRVNSGAFGALTSAKSSAALALASGLNRIETRVTAEDGVTTRSYILNITRTPSATGVTNLFLKWNATNLAFAPSFATSTANYSLTVPNSVSQVSFLPTLASANSVASTRLNGGNFTSIAAGKASALLSLNAGVNTAELRVLSDDKTTSQTYSLVIDRLFPPVAGMAQAVTSDSFSLPGTIDARSTAAAFQFGLTGTFGTTLPVSLAGGSGVIPVATTVTGLRPSTLYYYRLTSQFAGVTDVSTPRSFVTQPRIELEPLMVSGASVTGFSATPATFATFGNPSINNLRNIAFQSTMAFTGANASNNSGIWVTKNGSLVLAVRAGTAAPGGGVFAKFGDPQLNNDGRIAFTATLQIGVQGVTAANANGIWQISPEGTLSLVARTGTAAPGTGGALFSGFTSMVLPDTKGPIFTATLTTNGTAVTTANNSGLWATNNASSVVLVARKGAQPTPTLSSFSIFNAEAGRNGQSRHFRNNGNLLLTAQFGTGAVGIYKVSYPTFAISSASPAVANLSAAPGARGALFSALGNPIMNSEGAFAFSGTLSGNGVLTTNNTGVWLYGSNGAGSQVIRTGQSAPGGGIFKTLSAPVLNSSNEVAFMGTLSGSGVTTTNAAGIWSADSSGNIQQIVRAGAAAPGISGAVFSTFTQLAYPDEAGVVFVATMAAGTGGITATNNVGLWAAEAPGDTPELIVRKGDSFTVGSSPKTISDILIFNPSTETAGAARHMNALGDLVFKITFTDGSSGLFRFLRQ
jgi:hypothetical protein